LATNDKDFKIKNGLIVQGATATVNGNNVLTTASDIEDLSNVDTSGVADGNALIYDSVSSTWIPGEAIGTGGGGSYTISPTTPSDPSEGDVWFDSVTGNTYIYYSDYDNDQWVQTSGPNTVLSRGANLTVSSTAPAAPVSGDLWYDPTEGYTYLYYEDFDSSQWVQFGLNRNGASGSNGTDGINGVNGTNGVGVPVGGSSGQILTKSSSTDYETEWSNQIDTSSFTTVGKAIAVALVFG
jgi:hypothetical protein